MPEPFERTTRYLAADGGRLAQVGAVSGLIIAALWLAWLLLAQVPLYVQAPAVESATNGVYQVNVDLVAATHLKLGQRASLQPATPQRGGADAPLLAARVATIDLSTGSVRIELDDAEQRPASGTVWMLTEQVSPATLFMRAIEQTFAAS